MRGFGVLSAGEIEESLVGVTRQYLVGDLKRPQKLPHIKDENLEMGITSYSEGGIEGPHYHSTATEYQYVLSGSTTYFDLGSNKEHKFSQGDFYVIHPNTTYAQKSLPGTAILFIKVPSINDKHAVEVSSEMKRWYKEGDLALPGLLP